MPASELLRLIIQADTAGAVRGMENLGASARKNLDDADTRTAKLAGNLQKFGAGAVVTGSIVAAGLYKAGQAAADLEQAVGGTEAVFKDASGTIDAYAKNAAQKMGLSERAFREATTSMGGQLKALGFSTDDAATKAIELTGVAADLAATYGGTTAEAVQALGAAFRGEADPAERFLLRLNQTTVNAKAVEMGLAASTSQVSAQAKAQATLALITEQSADALGQFGREAGTASGQMQIANAEFENAKASLGQSIAPIMADVAGGLSKLAGGFQNANEASGGLLSKIAGFGAIALVAGGGIAYTVGKAMELSSSFSDLSGPFRNAEGGLSKLSKVAAAAGGAFAAFAVFEIADSMNQTTVEVDKLSAALERTDGASQESVQGALRLADEYGGLEDIVKQTAETNMVAAERLLEAAEAAGINGDELQRLKGIVEEQAEANVQGAKDQETNTAALEAAVGPTGDLAAETQTLAEKVEATNEAYSNLIDTVLGFADADLNLRESIDKTDDALFELAEAQKAAADEGGKNREANEALEDALFGAEAAILAQAEAAVGAAESNSELAGKTLGASEKQAILRASLQQSADKLAPGSALRANIDATIARLDELARDRKSNLDITIREQRISLTAKKDGERAAGGPVYSGKTYLVGERGPELVTMGGNGHVTPNSALGGGGGGGAVTPIVINVGGREVARLYAEGKVTAERRGIAS